SRRFELIPKTEVGGIPVTSPEATVLLLAGGMGARRLGWFVDELLTAHRVAVDGLEDVLAQFGGRDVPGSRVLAAVLAERQPGDPVPASRLERMFLSFCDEYRIAKPVWQPELPWWD